MRFNKPNRYWYKLIRVRLIDCHCFDWWWRFWRSMIRGRIRRFFRGWIVCLGFIIMGLVWPVSICCRVLSFFVFCLLILLCTTCVWLLIISTLSNKYYICIIDDCFSCLPPYAGWLTSNEKANYDSFVQALRQGYVQLASANDDMVTQWVSECNCQGGMIRIILLSYSSFFLLYIISLILYTGI